jgi:mono/diheme cytochrome c family protein
VIAALWKNDVRHFLILLNFVALAALIVYLVVAVLSPRRSRHEEREAPNVVPFLRDEDLEGRRLERVQGWALIFAAVIAIALPIYWLREPTRQSQSASYFDRNSVNRGAVLFASPGTPEYQAATSKQCANCHGDKGQGGVAPFRIGGQSVNWKAPPLNTEALRFTEEPACADPSLRQPTTICEITDIITYGRPGTPMQGWGIAGGGPLNDQGIADLVAFIKSIQLTPAQSQAQAAKALEIAKNPNPGQSDTCPEYMSCPAIATRDARTALDAARSTLAQQRKAAQTALRLPGATDAELTKQCDDLTHQVTANPSNFNLPADVKARAVACGTYLDAVQKASDAQAAYAWALDWQRRRANVSDGQMLFELNCARCHTEGWSVFDPTAPPTAVNGVSILGLSGGGGGQGGGIGFNLRDGDVMRRFGTDANGGFATQLDFVKTGSDPNKPYGILGLGSGKMPGFGQMLTADDVGRIVAYERYCLDSTNYNSVSPSCNTDPQPRTPPTSTTTTVAKG